MDGKSESCWFKKYVCIIRKKVLCRWIRKLRSFLDQEFTVLTFFYRHSYTYYSLQLWFKYYLLTYIFLFISSIVWADAWIIHLFSLFVLQTLPKTICCLKFKHWTVRCQMFCICSIYVPWPQQQWSQKKRSQTLPQKNWGLQPQLCSFYIDR